MAEKTESLGKYVVYTSENCYPITADSLALAAFAALKEDERVADVCAGCGVVGFAAAERILPKTLDFFELNPTACDLIAHAVRTNGTPSQVFCGRVQDAMKERAGQYGCVLCNPPYYPAQGQPLSEVGSIAYYRAAAKTDFCLTAEETVDAANRLLSGGGRVCLCVPIERLSTWCALLENKKIPVKRLQLVRSQVDRAPYLALIEARKGARGGLAVLPDLTVGEKI